MSFKRYSMVSSSNVQGVPVAVQRVRAAACNASSQKTQKILTHAIKLFLLLYCITSGIPMCMVHKLRRLIIHHIIDCNNLSRPTRTLYIVCVSIIIIWSMSYIIQYTVQVQLSICFLTVDRLKIFHV